MKCRLNNNQLKIIALVTMTVDHVGVMLFPQVWLLRLIGRLSFPIYAYMIAEGCAHTSNMGKYLGTMASLAAVCQLVYFFAMGSVHQSILVTFCLSIGLIWLLKMALEKRTTGLWLLTGAGFLTVLLITEGLPLWLMGTDFAVDYGFLGVLLPVAVWLGKTKKQKLMATFVILALMSMDAWVGQWAGLLALPLLALYDGSRGKRKMKWLFYLYYPAHLALLEAVVYLFF